jgi:hypothetical protein
MKHRPDGCPKCHSRDVVCLPRNGTYWVTCCENVFVADFEEAARIRCGYSLIPGRDYCGYEGPRAETEAEAVELWNGLEREP